MTKEIFKPIHDFEDRYLISNLGRLKNIRRRKHIIMKQQMDNRGYYVISLIKNGIVTKKQIHRLVYEAFVCKLLCTDIIHHRNENKLDNELRNLIITDRSNHRKMHSNIGIKTRYTRVWELENYDILIKYAKYNSTQKIADEIGCNQKTVERFIVKTTGMKCNEYKKLIES